MALDVTFTTTRLVTGAELADMQDIGPCELVEGRIVPMSPTGDEHGGIESNIGAELRAFARAHKLGKVRVGEVGIFTRRNPDSIRAADVFYISNERYARKESDSFLDVAPELVVEILSPGDSWSSVAQKLREYFAIGVAQMWVVDPESRSVHVYRSPTDAREFTVGDTLSSEDVLPGFSVKVATLFED